MHIRRPPENAPLAEGCQTIQRRHETGRGRSGMPDSGVKHGPFDAKSQGMNVDPEVIASMYLRLLGKIQKPPTAQEPPPMRALSIAASSSVSVTGGHRGSVF